MPEPKVLLLGSAMSEAESKASLDVLCNLNIPNCTKYVVTTGKFDAGDAAKTFNVESGYPAEPAHLQTLAAWAEEPRRADARFQDGYDLFCLKNVIARGIFDYAVLVRSTDGLNERFVSLLREAEGKLFLTLGGQGDVASVLFDLTDERSSSFLNFAWRLYETGAAYAMSPYSLDHALRAAADARQLEMQLAGDAS